MAKLVKTRGIVLGFLRYRETSLIVNIFTEAFGTRAYIVNGARSEGKKKNNAIAFYQPLTLLDLLVYDSEKSDLHRISECRIAIPLFDLPLNVHKSSVALFLSEVLRHALKAEEENEPIFEFIFQSISILDQLTQGVAHFHLQFLLKLATYLGFAPQNAAEFGKQMQENGLLFDYDTHQQNLEILLDADYGCTLSISADQRDELLDNIISFYQIYLENFGKLKSLAVLKEVYRES